MEGFQKEFTVRLEAMLQGQVSGKQILEPGLSYRHMLRKEDVFNLLV